MIPALRVSVTFSDSFRNLFTELCRAERLGSEDGRSHHGGYFLELCLDCGELVESIKEPNQSIDPDDPPSYDLCCPKCGFVFETRPE
jgi:hypothetical protein